MCTDHQPFLLYLVVVLNERPTDQISVLPTCCRYRFLFLYGCIVKFSIFDLKDIFASRYFNSRSETFQYIVLVYILQKFKILCMLFLCFFPGTVDSDSNSRPSPVIVPSMPVHCCGSLDTYMESTIVLCISYPYKVLYNCRSKEPPPMPPFCSISVSCIRSPFN